MRKTRVLRALGIAALVPLLGAYKCTSNVRLSTPSSGATYCGSAIPVLYDMELDRDTDAYVVVGVHFPASSSSNVEIIQNYKLTPGYYSRTISASIPWSRVAAYRGQDAHVFVDIGNLANVGAAGKTMTYAQYKSAISDLWYLHGRSTKSVKICP